MTTLWGAWVIGPNATARCWSATSAFDPDRDTDDSTVSFSDVRDVAAGNAHVCIVGTAGGDRCRARFPHLAAVGPDVPFQNEWSDVPMPFASPVAKLHAKPYATCALSVAGDVACWGLDDAGQLGIVPDGANDARVWTATSPVW